MSKARQQVHDLKKRAARKTAFPPARKVPHPLIALQRSLGNSAITTALAGGPEGSTTQAAVGSTVEPARKTSHEQELREEVAGALNVLPGDARVDAALFGDFEIAAALKEARQLDEAAKAPEKKPPQTEIREDPFKGMTIEQRERKMREDAVKEELSRLGITDEMLLKGYRTETPVQLGPDMRGRMVDEWIPEGVRGRLIHTFELERAGTTDRVVTTTDFAKGGEQTIVRTTIAGGKETAATTVHPGYGKLGARAALEKTSTRWVQNPDGSVTVETLDKYGRPIPGRSWKPDVLKQK
jgi:hypothetical protein